MGLPEPSLTTITKPFSCLSHCKVPCDSPCCSKICAEDNRCVFNIDTHETLIAIAMEMKIKMFQNNSKLFVIICLLPITGCFPDLGNYPGEVASPTWGLVSPDLGIGFPRPGDWFPPTWGLVSPDLGKYPGEVQKQVILTHKCETCESCFPHLGIGFPRPGDWLPPTWGTTLGRLPFHPGELTYGSCDPDLGK